MVTARVALHGRDYARAEQALAVAATDSDARRAALAKLTAVGVLVEQHRFGEADAAMAALAACLENADGCDRDVATAVEWYGKAAAAGDPVAAQRLVILAVVGGGGRSGDGSSSSALGIICGVVAPAA